MNLTMNTEHMILFVEIFILVAAAWFLGSVMLKGYIAAEKLLRAATDLQRSLEQWIKNKGNP